MKDFKLPRILISILTLSVFLPVTVHAGDMFTPPEQSQTVPVVETAAEVQASPSPAPFEPLSSLQSLDSAVLNPVVTEPAVMPAPSPAPEISAPAPAVFNNPSVISDFPADPLTPPEVQEKYSERDIFDLNSEDGVLSAPGKLVKEIETLRYEEEIEVSDEDGKSMGKGTVVSAYIDLEKMEVFYGVQLEGGSSTFTDAKGREITDPLPLPAFIHDIPFGQVFRMKRQYWIYTEFKISFYENGVLEIAKKRELTVKPLPPGYISAELPVSAVLTGEALPVTDNPDGIEYVYLDEEKFNRGFPNPGRPVKEVESLEYEQEITVTDEDGKEKGTAKVIDSFIDLEKRKIIYFAQFENGVITMIDDEGREMTDVTASPDWAYGGRLGRLFESKADGETVYSIGSKFKVYFFNDPSIIAFETERKPVPAPVPDDHI